MSSWVNFETLWSSNPAVGNIGATCKFASGDVAVNTDRRTKVLKTATRSVTNEMAVHPAFILAMVLQESNWCVRAPTTSSWEVVQNSGLMQSFEGVAMCNECGKMTRPCPAQVYGDGGVNGSNNFRIIPALKMAVTRAEMSWPVDNTAMSEGQMPKQQKRDDQVEQSVERGVEADMTRMSNINKAMLYYQAARIYNSGSVLLDEDLSSSTGCARCYASDIMNRLMGWDRTPNACSLA